MSGLGLVLNIAKTALAAQQYGINVTAHNIANVSTPGYSGREQYTKQRNPGLMPDYFLAVVLIYHR